MSSWSLRQVDGAPPPGWPSKSASALTVITSSYAAGVERGGVGGVVAGRDDEGDAVGDGLADRGVLGVVVGRAAVAVVLAAAAEAHVGDLDLVGVGGDVVDAADRRRRWCRCRAALSTFTGQIRAPGATPTTPVALSSAPMVPATWEPWPWSSSALPSPNSVQFSAPGAVDVEVGVVEVDAGVDDGDVGVDPLVRAVDGGGRADVGLRPVDAGRGRLRGGRDLAVLLHEVDAGERLDQGGGLRRHGRRVALERGGVDVAEVEAEAVGVGLGDGPGDGRVVEHDDVAGRGA